MQKAKCWQWRSVKRVLACLIFEVADFDMDLQRFYRPFPGFPSPTAQAVGLLKPGISLPGLRILCAMWKLGSRLHKIF